MPSDELPHQAPQAIPLAAPSFNGTEWTYVKECLDAGWVSSAGPFVGRFEQAVADVVKVPHAIATSSGTAALHVALLLAEVAPDDEVLVPALTFIAPINAVRYVGAWPVFMDVDPTYWQMDMERVRLFLERNCVPRHGRLVNRNTGRRVAAILPVDLLGHPVNMDEVCGLAATYNLAVVEDASESFGALYKGAPVGSQAALACLSFNGNKVATSGGGGMIITHDAALAARARHLTTQARCDVIEYAHDEVGYNYRLTSLQAAVGFAQLEDLPARVAAKRTIAQRYAKELANLPGLSVMNEAPWACSSYWLSTVRLDPTQFGLSSRDLLSYLAERGIQSRPLWQPGHLNSPYMTCESNDCHVAEQLWRTALSLPSSVDLSMADQQRVIDAIRTSSSRRPP